MKLAKELKIETDVYEEVCELAEIKEELLKDLTKIGKAVSVLYLISLNK
jgi:hypothetical protein